MELHMELCWMEGWGWELLTFCAAVASLYLFNSVSNRCFRNQVSFSLSTVYLKHRLAWALEKTKQNSLINCPKLKNGFVFSLWYKTKKRSTERRRPCCSTMLLQQPQQVDLLRDHHFILTSQLASNRCAIVGNMNKLGLLMQNCYHMFRMLFHHHIPSSPTH